MILCIESHLGDRYLTGKARTKTELKQQLLHTESIRDVENDNFLPLLCRLYGFEETEETVPDCTWDRDTGLLLRHPPVLQAPGKSLPPGGRWPSEARSEEECGR